MLVGFGVHTGSREATAASSSAVSKVRLTVARTDTLLAHCIARAIVVDAGGEGAAREKYGDEAETLRGSKWRAFKVAAKATPRASRVAAFIALWGLALYDLDRDELTVDEYAKWASESRPTAFRRAAEYRELWGDKYDDVNQLARLVRDHIREHTEARRHPNALTSISVAI